MTLREFEERYLQEMYSFLKLCEEERVLAEAARVVPVLAPELAEDLILVLSDDGAREQIRRNKPGAAALAMLAQEIARERRARPALAANMPQENRTPFYVLSAMVLDAAREDQI